MRDPKQLRAFELADQLALLVYKHTRVFPSDERFGLTSQLRRAAVSAASNIVEGCSRDSQSDFVRFLQMSHGSAAEVEYQLSLARRLKLANEAESEAVEAHARETCKVLIGLIQALR